MLKAIGSIVMAGVLVLSSVAVASPAQAKVKAYKDCAAMYKAYPYGVKLKGAKDKVKADFSPVTNSKQVSSAIYNASKKLDWDKDKMICERPKYKNCAKLNTKYKHGLGLSWGKDTDSKGRPVAKPVKNFTVVDWPTYNTNSHLDRDKDEISCEKI